MNDGVAGGSARREHERRRARDEAKTRERWGRLGGVAVALSTEKQSTRAWSTGAVGEEHVGRTLESVASPDVRVLHDRRIPGSRANIDHIVVTAGGVLVIDAKRYVDKRPSLRVTGGLFSPRRETLLVGGREQTKLVDGMLRQVALVAAEVPDVPARGYLCFVESDWPLIGGEFTINGIEVLWPRLLKKRVLAASNQGVGVDVTAVADALARRFRSA